MIISGQGYNGFDLDATITAVVNGTTATLAYAPRSTATGQTATISAPALTILDSATGAFTAADIGKAVQAAGSTTLFGTIEQYIPATRVVPDKVAAVTVTGASTTITRGTLPLSWVDDGTLAPSGALPGNPAGQTVRNTPWTSQTGDVEQWQDNAGATTQRINKNGRHVFKVGTARVLADLADGEATLWTDTDGTLKVTVRAAGALKSGSVAVA